MLSVVLPAYNEEARLGASLGRLTEFLRRRGGPYEVVVVDDGSSDGTRALAERRAQTDRAIRVIGFECNRGKGAAVRAGMLAARGEWILMSDVDLATPLEELERLEARRDRADVVVASRALPGAQIEVRESAAREWLGRGYNCAVRLMAVPGVRDTQCGFKLWSRRAARAVFSRLAIARFSFDVESLMLARRLGYRLVEVPVRWRHDARSTVRVGRDGARMAIDLVRILLRRVFG